MMKDYTLKRQFNALRILGINERSFMRSPISRNEDLYDAEAIFAAYAFEHLRDKGMPRLEAYEVIAERLRLRPSSIRRCIKKYETYMAVDPNFRHKVEIYEKELARLDNRARKGAEKQWKL